MRRTLVLVLIGVAACSPADTAETSTTTTTPETTTSTGSDPTTTAPRATTTTVATTTTTTEATTTTSETLLEGNWAPAPLVTTGFGALGWWDGSGWLDAASESELPVEGDEDYQVTVLDELNRTTAGPQTTVCELLELIGVELADPDLLGSYPGPYGVAISAPWTLQPHLFEAMTDEAYAEMQAQFEADSE